MDVVEAISVSLIRNSITRDGTGPALVVHIHPGKETSPPMRQGLCHWRRCLWVRYSQAMSEQQPTPGADQNLLEHAASSYLRSARHQPVQWHAWSDEAFALAKAEDKP